MRCLPFLVGCFFSVAVGANIVRPRNFTLPINSPGGYGIRPYANPKAPLCKGSWLRDSAD